ncbi:hypothetical protein ABRP17_010460 [Stenotrophomonas sp. WHRI 8082]|uniref:hypothetical protein n=1 Tax=Stenotrophomonas sp. WHRI 8082 TaxID=3162571 RepID=UPI0032EB1D52
MNIFQKLKTPSLLLAIFFSGICGCAGGISAEMFRFCINGEEDMDILGRMVNETAALSGMEFYDKSQVHDRAARDLGDHPGYKMKIYAAGRADGLGVIATNSLGAREATIGFTRGSNSEESQAMIDKFLHSLDARWKVRGVPADHGALPSAQCDVPK